MGMRTFVVAIGIGMLGLWSVPAFSEEEPAPETSRMKFQILAEAPLDEVVGLSSVRLAEIFREISQENISTTRLLEGGEFNINIRHVVNVSSEDYGVLNHPDTIDVWIVQEGSGTMVTGGEVVDGKHSGGEERFISVGDLIYIPAGMSHGIKETSAISWYNIRFPEHRN